MIWRVDDGLDWDETYLPDPWDDREFFDENYVEEEYPRTDPMKVESADWDYF